MQLFIKTVLTIWCLLPSVLFGQQFDFELLTSNPITNLRGLSAVDDNVIWVCGNRGQIGHTINGGKTWRWTTPSGFSNSDFRAIYAIDSVTAIVMATSDPAMILRTENGGQHWEIVFAINSDEVFLDAIDFWNPKEGVCMGDWTAGQPFTLLTSDSGKTWQFMSYTGSGAVADTLALFAASGTCMRAHYNENGEKEITAVLCGTADLIFRQKADENFYSFINGAYETRNRKPSRGIFSVAVDTINQLLWLVGGDFEVQASGYSRMYDMVSGDFIRPVIPVNGYRSCVELFKYGNASMAIACGPTGIDVTTTSRQAAWLNVSSLPLNVARKARKTGSVFLAGQQGTVFKMNIVD